MHRYGTLQKPHLGRPVGTQLTTDPRGIGPASEPAVWVDAVRLDVLLANGVAVETTDGVAAFDVADESAEPQPEPTEPPKRRGWQPKE